MNIYILRHAIAVERGTPGYEDDSLRPLTPSGIRKMQSNALGMKAMDLTFDLILSSPYIRAKQTAEIVTQTFKTGHAIILTNNLIPDASFETLLSEIQSHEDKAKNILLVGHEPFLSEFVSFLLTGKTTLALTLKKGGLCYLSTENLSKSGRTTLNWLMTPSQLRLIHQK